jgi:hypothetical protein
MPARQVRPTVSNAIEWAVTVWNELSASTVKNCWNHAKILPLPLTSGPVDATIDELTARLIHVADSSLDVDSLVNHWHVSPSKGQRNLSQIMRRPQLHMRRATRRGTR